MHNNGKKSSISCSFFNYNLFITSLIFILLGAEFLGLLLIIVYVGAISVLFLFVVMMLNSRFLELYNNFFMYFSVLFFFCFIFIFELLFFFLYDVNIYSYYFIENNLYNIWIYSYNWVIDIKLIGQLLFNYYYLFLIISGFILLIAMIGSVVLTHDANHDIKTIDYNITRYTFRGKTLNKAYGIFTK